MTQIEMEAATGRSKNNLMEAIADAFRQALAGRNHRYSITLIIDGYEFNGEEFRANVRIILYDLDEDKEELYRHIEEEHQKRVEEEMINEMYAAFYNRALFPEEDSVADQIKDAIDKLEETQPPQDVRVIATPEMHDRLEKETGYPLRYETARMPKPHTDLAEPALGPGGASSGKGDSDSRAA